MAEIRLDFRRVLEILNEAGVRFVVVGGVAMRLHGANHFTDDIDIGYARGVENATALAQALAPHHPRLRGVPDDVPFMLDARTFRNTLNLTLETDIGDLDLPGDVAGVDSFDGLWERAVEMDLDGLCIRAANRVKDRTHLLEEDEAVSGTR